MIGVKTMFQALHDAWLIRRSGLLQETYYRSQFYHGLKADRFLLKVSPVLHYVFFGAAQNKNPNPLFDTEYYRDRNPDAVRSRQNPLAHFLRFGAARKLDPGPFFETHFYLDRCPSAARSGQNPLVHYFARGQSEGSEPNAHRLKLSRVGKPMPVDYSEGRCWLQAALGAPSSNVPRSPGRPDRAIRFDWDIGGWNNIRMQVEVMACLADRYGRALILPPASKWYLLPGDRTHLFDFYDESAFRAQVPVLPPDTRLEDEWTVPAELSVLDTVRLRKEVFDRQADRASWYFPDTTRMFGWFASVLGSRIDDYRLVNRAFRLQAHLLDTAAALLESHGLRPGGYIAAHIRRGDFEQPAMRHLSTARIIDALRRHGADQVQSLLIVSDAYDEELLAACRNQGWETVCWSENAGQHEKFAGVLDMLCCCLAWRFVGTSLSTFSTGIIQWRGYLSKTAAGHLDAVPRFTSVVEQVPWWGGVDEYAWLTI